MTWRVRNVATSPTQTCTEDTCDAHPACCAVLCVLTHSIENLFAW